MNGLIPGFCIYLPEQIPPPPPPRPILVEKKPRLEKTEDKKRRGAWTDEENNILRELVARHGLCQWALIARCIPGRTGKQCRERWMNNLDPNLKTGSFTKEEDQVILREHIENEMGWCELSKLLPGRSENAIKNRFHSLKRQLDKKQ